MLFSPALWLGGSLATNGQPNTIQDSYDQLISSADVFTTTGARVFRMWSGQIDLASPRQVRVGAITEQQRQANADLLKAIGTYCRDHDIIISVEDNFMWSAQWIQSWTGSALQAGLPVAMVDGGENLLGVQDTTSSLQSLASTMAANAKLVAQAFPGVLIGDIEPVIAANQVAWSQELRHWWATYNEVALVLGAPTLSYFIGDIDWHNANTDWLPVIAQTHTDLPGMSFGLVINGFTDSLVAEQWTATALQHIAYFGPYADLTPDIFMLETWSGGLPSTVTPLNRPGTMGWLATAASRLFVAYHGQPAMTTKTLTITAAPQLVVQVGQASPLHNLTVCLSDDSAGADDRIAILLVSETAILTATPTAQGQVVGDGSNAVLLAGTIPDIATMIASVRVMEGSAGPDTIWAMGFNATGGTGVRRIDLLATPNSGSSFAFDGAGTSHGWVSATAELDDQGMILAETSIWNTSDTSPIAGHAPQMTLMIHSPLTSASLQLVASRLVNPLAQGNQTFDPIRTYSGTTFVVALLGRTMATFDRSTGHLMTERSTIMADPDAQPWSPLARGGMVTTQYNTGTNPEWQAGWSSALESVSTIASSDGVPIESVYTWSPDQSYLYSILVWSPAGRGLWEESDALPAPGGFATGYRIVTEFNTGDNPNWDYIRHATDRSVATIFHDGLALQQFVAAADGSHTVDEWSYDQSRLWSWHQQRFDASSHLTSEAYRYPSGGALLSSKLVYDVPSGWLWQRWDHPTEGGYVLTQYDVTGTAEWSSFVQTVGANNKLASLLYTFDPGNTKLTTLRSFDSVSGTLQQETNRMTNGSVQVSDWDTAATQPWSKHVAVRNAANVLVSEHYDWDIGQSYATTDLTYRAATGALYQRWDRPAAGGYVLTQYDVDNTADWSRLVQTVLAGNKLASLYYVMDPGRSTATITRNYDTTTGALKAEVDVLPDGRTQTLLWDTQRQESWSKHTYTSDPVGRMIVEHYDWDTDPRLTSSDLTYAAGTTLVSSRTDYLIGGGSIISQFDTTGLTPVASTVRTMDATNHVVMQVQTMRAGQATTEIRTWYDPANVSIREVDTVTASTVAVVFYRGDGSIVYQNMLSSALAVDLVHRTAMHFIHAAGINETLIGTTQADDFVLGTTPGTAGALETISGFQVGRDVLTLPRARFGDWDRITQSMTSSAEGLLVRGLNANDRLLVAGLTAGQLTHGDVSLV